MPVTDTNCPNCGAPIDFGGAATARCSFCNSRLTLTSGEVKAESELLSLLEQTSVPPGVDVDRVQQLLLEGKKIEAIKLVREQSDLGLKEAKDFVEALERGEQPEQPPRSEPAHTGRAQTADEERLTELLHQGKKLEAIKLYREQTDANLQDAKRAIDALEQGQPLPPLHPRRRSTTSPQGGLWGCLVGCLPILLFMGLCVGFIMLSSQIAFRVWGPLNQTLELLNSSEAMESAFGEPLTLGPFITGGIGSSGASSRAGFEVPIYGPKRSGWLEVSGSWRSGVWDVTIWVAYEDDNGEPQTIRISQKVK
jgi:ribosomal protein L7/L12